MFVFRKNSILNLFLAQEMSRSFGGLYFTRRNHINSKFSQSEHKYKVTQATSWTSESPLHQESGQKPGKPGKARPGQACRAFGRACQKSTAWKSQSSPAKAVLLWPPWQPNLGKPGLGRTFGATMATKARLSRACKFDARISWLSWSVTYWPEFKPLSFPGELVDMWIE